MKNLLLVTALCLCAVFSFAATYYVAPNGSNSNPGTITAPFATIDKLSSVMVAGDIAYIRGGTYRTTGNAGSSQHFVLQNLNGTSGSPIKIWAYPGEKPVFNLDNITPTNGNPTAFRLVNSKYVHIKGIRVTGLKQHSGGSGISRGFHVENLTNSTIEFVEVDNIGGYGFYLRDGANDNLFLNCDAHHIDDRYSGWGNGNGFDCSGGVNATRNTFDGCRVWWASDDGFDFYATNGVQTLKNCWAFWNGFQPGTFTKVGDGDGFKLGPDAGGVHNTLLRTVTNCISFENKQHGFNQNVGDMKVKLYNNTSFKNGHTGYMWDFVSPAPVQDFKNNVSYMDVTARRGNETTGSNNTWNGITVGSGDFLSTSSAGADGPRGADGSLPVLNFLKLNTASNLINKGINVGLPFASNAPDLGAFEANGGGSSPANVAPTANAGADKTITLPTNSTTITGAGTDTDGSISAYSWSKVSGPTGGTISNTSSATTGITALVQGIYVFQLKVTDNNGATATDNVQITVNPVAPVGNTAPTANAGADKTITLPTSSVSLAGSGSDVGGSIAGYLWTKVSGPSGGAISSATAATTSVTGLVQGSYVYQLKVTDNQGATGVDNVTVTVNPAASSGGTGLKVIRVNIYSGTTTYNHAKWNNWKPSANVTSAKFKYEDGTASNVTASLSAQSKIHDNGSTYMSTTTICPAPVMRFASAYSGTRTFTIKNLNPAKQYSFEFYSSANVSTATKTEFIINGWSYPISTYNNKNSYAEFINVRPNSSGTVTVTLKKTGTYNYLTAFTIIEQTGQVSSVPVTNFSKTAGGDVSGDDLAITEAQDGVSVSTFPLPFSTSFTVSLQGGEEGEYKLTLVDMNGKTVWNKAITKSGVAATETIYMGNLPAGVYLLQVISPDQKKTTKQLIKN